MNRNEFEELMTALNDERNAPPLFDMMSQLEWGDSIEAIIETVRFMQTDCIARLWAYHSLWKITGDDLPAADWEMATWWLDEMLNNRRIFAGNEFSIVMYLFEDIDNTLDRLHVCPDCGEDERYGEHRVPSMWYRVDGSLECRHDRHYERDDVPF